MIKEIDIIILLKFKKQNKLQIISVMPF
jgi:hypothetical protein